MNDSGYSLDLNEFPREKLQEYFKHTRLLPSQRILQEEIDARFSCLKQQGIDNLQQLQTSLKTKAAVQNFASQSGLPVDYRTVLRREVNSYQPKPIKLINFPGLNPDVITRLDEAGIKNTRQLFPHLLSPKKRDALARETQIAAADLMELTRLTDVARVKWVGPKFARLLVESPYDKGEKIAAANIESLYEALVQVNEEKEL